MEPPVCFDAQKHRNLLPQIVDLHVDCVETDHTMATFLPPFNDEKRHRMFAFWSNYANSPNTYTIILQLVDEEVAGYVVLKDCGSETGRFRAEVLKLLVSPRHRKQGIARRLMEKLEEVALVKGLTMLMLDTTVGTPAEHVYPRLGYHKLGIVPKFGISGDGRLCDELWFWKMLPGHGAGFLEGH